jgi:hypothetical protein
MIIMATTVVEVVVGEAEEEAGVAEEEAEMGEVEEGEVAGIVEEGEEAGMVEEAEEAVVEADEAAAETRSLLFKKYIISTVFPAKRKLKKRNRCVYQNAVLEAVQQNLA